MAALTAATCVSPPITEMRWALGLPGWVGQYLADKAVESQLDAGRRLFRALHVGQPAESKVGNFSFSLLLFARENLRLTIGKDKGQLM